MMKLALKEAERLGANDAEAYASTATESEVFIENNDLKQAKSQTVSGIGVRVLVDGSPGFSSVNSLKKDLVFEAVSKAIKVARVSPRDKFNLIPKKMKIKKMGRIYDKNAGHFHLADAAKRASEMLQAAKSFDPRVTVDSGNFTGGVMVHSLLNSNGQRAKETISIFSWSIMGMAVEGGEVSSFDSQHGSSHYVRDIDVEKTASAFAEAVINSLRPRKVDSFKGEMLLTPSAASELLQEVITHSINSDEVQRGSSHFKNKVGKRVASEILSVEDDATNVAGLSASSFDREGVPHRKNIMIEKGMLKRFIYDTRTANKDDTKSTGNAGGSINSPPSVSTTNFIIRPGRSRLDSLISEIRNGIIINRFSGNVNPVNGDFSGVVKGGKFVKNGSVEYAVKDLMVAGNVFDALLNITGISKETKVIYDSILPHTRFDKVSFTSG